MLKSLFSNSKKEDDNLFSDFDETDGFSWIVKMIFQLRKDRHFVKSLNRIVNRHGVGDEYSGCMFPEGVDPVDDEPFQEGICCWYKEEEVIVSEQGFYDVMSMACKKYIQFYPDKKEDVEQILAKWEFTA